MRDSRELQVGIYASHGIWEVDAAVKEYAVYKGDEFLAIGTIEELAEKFKKNFEKYLDQIYTKNESCNDETPVC